MITSINEWKKINEAVYNGPLVLNDKIELIKRFEDYTGSPITFSKYVKRFENEDDAQREIDHFLDGYCPDNIDYEDAADYVYTMCGWNVNMKNESVRIETKYCWKIFKDFTYKIMKTENDLAEDAFYDGSQMDKNVLTFGSESTDYNIENKIKNIIEELKRGKIIDPDWKDYYEN